MSHTNTKNPNRSNNNSSTNFRENTQTFIASNTINYSDNYQTSKCINLTFFIKNIGNYIASMQFQISPDDSLFINDSAEMLLEPGQSIAVSNLTFAKYTRICFKTINPQLFTKLEVTIQAIL